MGGSGGWLSHPAVVFAVRTMRWKDWAYSASFDRPDHSGAEFLIKILIDQ